MAIGEGSDVAIEVADIVLMKNDMVLVSDLIKRSRKLNKIIWQKKLKMHVLQDLQEETR